MLSLAAGLAVSVIGLMITLMGQEALLDSFSSVLGLLLANVMIALAVGGIIREGRRERIRAQTELVTGYVVAPLGLFTLDSDGRFLRMNLIMREMLALNEPHGDPLYCHDLFPQQDRQPIAHETLACIDTDLPVRHDNANQCHPNQTDPR